MRTIFDERVIDARSMLAVLIISVFGSADPGRLLADEGTLVEGVVTYAGPIPDPVPIPEAASKRQLVEVDPATGGLKDAVVWVEGVAESTRPDAHPADGPILMDQQNYEFIPHVLAIEDGQEIEFLNSDVANHGVSSRSSVQSNRFNVTKPPGGSHIQRFSAARLPVSIGCPIHASMSAWVFVFDHPFHAVTDSRGEFRLPPIPPGRYVLRVHHPDGEFRLRRELTVTDSSPLRLRLPLEPPDSPRRSGPPPS